VYAARDSAVADLAMLPAAGGHVLRRGARRTDGWPVVVVTVR